MLHPTPIRRFLITACLLALHLSLLNNGLALIINTNDPPKCPPAQPRGNHNDQNPNACDSFARAIGACGAMPRWWVSEPYISVRLEDEPLGYTPALGPKVTFHISYRQRGALPDDPAIFGVGPNWSCSFASYVAHLASDPADVLRLHKAGAGWITYTGGTAQPLDGSIITTTASGYKIEFDDGSTTLFEQTTTDSTGQTCYFATLQADPEGNALSFSYSTTTPSCIQNTIFTNQSFTGHISMDAASRIAF